MEQALIAPTERGYNLADLKRAALIYDKVFISDPGDRELFPTNAMGLAVGMSMSIGSQAIRPMGKAADYDLCFEELVDAIRPLIDDGVVEVISSYDRSVIDGTRVSLVGVRLGGYPLNVTEVLQIYRAMARGQEFLRAALDPLAIELAQSVEGHTYAVKGAADGWINDEPALPVFQGQLTREDLRPVLTTIARSRIGMALKTWGIAEQRGIVPVLPAAFADILDRMATGLRVAVDAADPDPYWARRTAILDVVLGEYFSDNRLAQISAAELLKFRTDTMRKASDDRSKLFAELRVMAGEQTNLDLAGFKERVQERLKAYESTLRELNEQRRQLGWTVTLEVARGVLGIGAAATTAGGLFHVALPVTLSTAAFAAGAWALGKVQENLPAVRAHLLAERNLQENAQFAVFRSANHLVEPFI